MKSGQKRFEEAEVKQKKCCEKTEQHVSSLRAESSGYETAAGGAAEWLGNDKKYHTGMIYISIINNI